MRTHSKINENMKTVPAIFINRKGLNTSFIQPENSTILVNDNQIASLDEDNVNTQTSAENTIRQSDSHVLNTDLGPSLQEEASAATTNVEQAQA